MAYIDYDKLTRVVEIALRIADDIVNIEISKIEAILQKLRKESNEAKEHSEYDNVFAIEIALWNKILRKLREGRRVGIGRLGYTDMLAATGHTYDDLEFIEEVEQTVAIALFQTDIILAEERGAFPVWELSKDMKSNFNYRMHQLLSTEWRNRYEKSGKRNISMSTISPTGSIALIAEVSHSIEPIFGVRTWKKNKVQGEGEYDTIDPETGDRYKTIANLHHPFVDWYTANHDLNYEEATIYLTNVQDNLLSFIVDKSPYKNLQAYSIDYHQKLKVQGIMQKYIDSAISNTLNLPENFPQEEMWSLVETAYKAGVKGLTCYRNHSRMNIISSSKEKKVRTTERPETLPCDIHNVRANGEDWTLFVGLLDNKPYELFALKNTQSSIKRLSNAKLVKNGKVEGRTTYNLRSDEIDLNDIVSLYSTGNEQALTRIISRQLREGKLPELLHDFEAGLASLGGFESAVKRILQLYLKDSPTVTNGSGNNQCPVCGANLIRHNSCWVCSKSEQFGGVCSYEGKCG